LLLGIRTSFKEDLQASVAELVYGEPLRIPGELLTPTANPVDPALLITELRQHMARLRPVPATRHASPTTFVHSDLGKFMHVFLRQDTTRRALEPPYSGSYRVLSRREKTLQLLVRGRPVTVSADRVKPAYTLDGANGETNYTLDSGSSTTRHTATALANQTNPSHPTIRHTSTAPRKDYTFRTPCTFSVPFQYLSNHLREGVMWEHPTVKTHNPYSFSQRENTHGQTHNPYSFSRTVQVLLLRPDNLYSQFHQSQSQSHITTNSQSASLSWCRTPSGANDQKFVLFCFKF
jgi:hypothetical protein